ncbi:MAG: winged helix-turn-helix transcriptional regulator [Chloroflexi bacterium]|nr:winged helix-turn-helix transcriptional regulator [Chloroflexota bacterium]
MEPIGYESQGPGLDATFAALADPTRRAILARLTEGEASVAELAAPFAMSQPAISKHLKVLERAGLVSRSRDRQRRPVRLEARPLGDAASWLSEYRRFWAGRFQRLDGLLAELQSSAVLPVDARSAGDQGTRATRSSRCGRRHHQGGHR